MTEVKRQTAYKCSIKNILEGNYVQRPGWDPNFIQLGDLQISRINLLAVIVGKEGNSFTLDDGTGQVQAMSFGEQNKFLDFDVGDAVIIIGRPREYNQKRFVVPEIMRKIENKKWIDYRKAELELQEKDLPEISEEKKTRLETPENFEPAPADEPVFDDNYVSKIISVIKKLDKGDGANTGDVIKMSGLEKAEKYIKSLINEGEIYEIRTGKLKVLE
ncbi:MAG: OB-fold nucleic acid binding domain-containing protein [Candidatus Nanoarchaeia archaeon]